MQYCSFWQEPYVLTCREEAALHESIACRIARKHGGMQLQFFVIKPALSVARVAVRLRVCGICMAWT
ncbi:hypothetical protein [Acetobacter pasteurianus]|uniref:Uncharacterized protein n=2 Tax=Acetobacter pasteurianus TaxID=438 RepID=C7JDR5_ACEP3|nr:hypothetical protein [Acetobacter pasteurianus]BAH98709.1 hypothetical protein APA01_05580 [Acetobacter pasteurianus IFO 3283-01]BAI01760.1 hypothetical protein APA03_05580 [Acetobacter pasteurianus IFO 3283-03]BAI04808.1 hypothetical protein APA07_05580 [Acetobacter pasteurianus IFO 3283-07]BAI07855.1 hypothetical protein APA22_05580 [Acetobacter pasteurianus IFO 3283-22]BAI10903.1 hypothetical protein APA26_05580 [Acetobacter pasteurianus IFO 3283-26]BAI13951.1 hypothetical protein APA32